MAALDRDAPRRTPPEVRLVPMSRELYEAWLDHAIRDYAEGHVAAGNWPAEGSVERSRAEFETLLPEGLTTPGMDLFSIRDTADEHVGIVWVGPRRGMPESLFIWDIEIEAAMRGRGFGEAALEALHAWAREHGYDRVGLHVFGSNEVARRLYLRTGYVETDVMMEKRL